jgi:hypothetical protein
MSAQVDYTLIGLRHRLPRTPEEAIPFNAQLQARYEAHLERVRKAGRLGLSSALNGPEAFYRHERFGPGTLLASRIAARGGDAA